MMSGFGIRAIAETQSAIEGMDDPILWRPESFLHQLSMSGEMLWVANHDEVWIHMLTALIADPDVSDWASARELLKTAPASEARIALYRASALWVSEVLAARPEIERFLLTQGVESSAALRSLDRELELRIDQVDQMRWCLDGRGSGEIGIINQPA